MKNIAIKGETPTSNSEETVFNIKSKLVCIEFRARVINPQHMVTLIDLLSTGGRAPSPFEKGINSIHVGDERLVTEGLWTAPEFLGGDGMSEIRFKCYGNAYVRESIAEWFEMLLFSSGIEGICTFPVKEF